MQLMSSKWYGVWIALSVGLIVFPSTLLAIGPYALVLLGLPILVFFFLPQRVVAQLDGDTLRIEGKSAPIADLLSVRSKAVRIMLLPIGRSMTFVVQPRNGDRLTERAAGARKLSLKLHNVEGGRAAGEAFAAQALAVANGRATLPAGGGVRADTATRGDGFDPDAIIARYLADRAPEVAAQAAPARPGFGRKGL
ncbi:hypothetical protein AB2M62_15735 [Sphingomonas sp. MMS12-HWE2-04]|uniref:hypothetical protein n=1 Tax=Sphingomonas sp. MMS12-HWE2-04 TaxID=3234199 RepID=UPI00384E717C